MVENHKEASDTVGCTLYSCLVLEDYVFVVVSFVMQLMTLGSFALSAFHGGNDLSIKLTISVVGHACLAMYRSFARNTADATIACCTIVNVF